MATTRRELLGAGALAALGLSSLGKTNSAFAQNSSTSAIPVSQTWDDGELEHLLPTSSHDRILIKASFKMPLGAAPSLGVGDQRISGLRSDTRGYFWQFHAGDLKPGTSYELSLRSSDGRSLSQSWKLSTMPAPDELPNKLRLLIYSCAGGHDLFSAAHTGFGFLPASVRRRLLQRGLSFAPDALIANGDHVYWDLLAPRAAPKLGASKAALEYARFDRDAPILGGSNESALLRAAGEQITPLYGTLCRSTPVFSCRMTTTISTMTRRQMRLSPSRPTISCCNRRGQHNGFGIPNSCLIQTGRPDCRGRIVRTGHPFAPPVSRRVSARCDMDASPKFFSMT